MEFLTISKISLFSNSATLWYVFMQAGILSIDYYKIKNTDQLRKAVEIFLSSNTKIHSRFKSFVKNKHILPISMLILCSLINGTCIRTC